jgi:glycerate dehydrogenase
MKAVFLDLEGLEDISLDSLKKQCSSLQLYQLTSPEEVAERVAGAELFVLNKVPMTRETLERSPDLKLICVVATGTDVIDLQATKELGITVCNCQAYGTNSVVQHVFTLMLALHTSLPSYQKAVQDGRWQKASQFCFLDYPIIELKGKTLGIVGYGTLGKGVAKMAEAFGMKILLAKRAGGTPDERPTLTEMLPEVDVLSLHCPLTDKTRNIINDEALSLMKPTAFLINAARGGLVDEAALLRALQSNQIAGAAIDVLSSEPPKNSHPLLETDLANLIITPHIAWASKEARTTIIEQTVENIVAYKKGSVIRNAG